MCLNHIHTLSILCALAIVNTCSGLQHVLDCSCSGDICTYVCTATLKWTPATFDIIGAWLSL